MSRVVTFSRLGRLGRLGNSAFQVASTIGIARKNGFDYAFPLWRNFDGLTVEKDIDIDVYKHLLHPLPRYQGPPLPERSVGWGYHDVVLSAGASLHGYLQSSRYFRHCLDEVRHYLRMRDEPPLNGLVALHVRRGDYAAGGGYHTPLPMDYYARALARLGRDERVLVFSDDVREARRMFGDGFEYSEGRGYLEDFRLMKRCKHFIIGNSSYSAMAAILGEHPDKQVVAPRPWFGPAAGITGEDIYDESWHVVDWEPMPDGGDPSTTSAPSGTAS
ncbi:MAG TPA: alpha-1,2-fucosyltransferase [Thermoanaerobaculia bacterium]|nr:alpha-1,2-fucosyltransferase [Thermoanaerobaculia bacterium]